MKNMQDYIPRKIDINATIDPVTVKQFDHNSRFLHVRINDIDAGDGLFDLTGCSATLYVQREGSDTPVAYVPGEVSEDDDGGGIVTFLLPGGVTQKIGRYECEIGIYQGDETDRPIISTKPFILTVEKSIKNADAIEATGEFSALDRWATDVQIIRNQMAALAASPAGSGGDVGTELRDVRTGADGTEYSTAGDAVRAQAANLAADTACLNGVIRFESGAFDGTYRKNKVDNVKRIRNTRPIPADQYLRLTLPDGYSAYFWLFDKNMNYLGNASASSLPVLNTGYPALKYINIQITKTDAANEDISRFISAVESGFTAVLRSKTDTSLSTPNLPADAKTVGDALNSLTGNLSSVDTALSKHIYAKDASAYVTNNTIALSDIVEDGFYIINNAWTITDAPSGLAVQALTVEHFSTYGANKFVKQTVESLTHPEYMRYHRCSDSYGNWTNWVDSALSPALHEELSKRIFAKDASAYVDNGSVTLGNIVEDGFYVINNTWTITDAPSGLAVQALTVEHFSTTGANRFVKQTVESMTHPEYPRYHRFSNVSGVWSDWVDDTSDNITNEYTFNSYGNTYNVTANPSITTDTNSFLAAAGDTADVTASIVAMLTQNGVCRLGVGDFYVSGIDMPTGSMLIGSGAQTRVILNGSGSYAVKLSDSNKVSDMSIVGSVTEITPAGSIGTRHGVLFCGNYTQTQSTAQQPCYDLLDSLWITDFSGGGITCYDTGYGSRSFLSADNINIIRCGAGINVSYWSEFHRFTNVRTNLCYYGCINNGGNNNFVNCNFSSCKVGFLMDNASGQSPNNSHGSVVGCTICHSDSSVADGAGIKILNCNNGYIFTGCQIFDSKIEIRDTAGVVISDCNFGASNCDIAVSGGGLVLFANNVHQDTPAITVQNNNLVKFANCYNRTSGAAISLT